MDVSIGADQELVIDTAARLAEAFATTNVADLPPRDGAATGWQQLAETGFVGLRLREPIGGAGSGIDVVIDVAPGGTATNFTTNWAFTADIPTDGSGFIPISTVPTLGGGLLTTSFGGGFYSQP